MSKSVIIRLSKRNFFLLFICFLILIGLCVSIVPIQRMIYPVRFSDTVEEMAAQCGIPPSLIYAVIHTESKFDSTAVSSANAKGLMQITDETYFWAIKRAGEEASTHNPDGLYNPEINIRAGCYILVLLSEQFNNTETVLAAYNAGQGRVSQWLKDPACSNDGQTLVHIPYEETANYVHRVINTQKKYQTLYNIL